MRKILLFIIILLCMVSCSRMIDGGGKDIVFDTPELHFDSTGGQATVTTDYTNKIMSWRLKCRFDEAGSSTSYYPEKGEDSIVLDNITVRYDYDEEGQAFDITVPPSKGTYVWELEVSCACDRGKIRICQNCIK